jgi:glutamine cyclotransferase
MIIQLPDFSVPHIDFDLRVDIYTDPILLSVDAPAFSEGIILFRKDFYKSLTYSNGKAFTYIARATMYYLGNGWHPFEFRLTLANGHLVTPLTGHLSVYLL